MITLLIIIYVVSALLLTLYILAQGALLLISLRHKSPPLPPLDDCPQVTVQLPLYNEQHVALRLIDAVAALDYPNLCVQVLDDSSDKTSCMINAHLKRYPHLRIEHIRRPERVGYKAGALAYGLSQTESEFIALFDADFLPPPDFLRRTLPYLLADDGLGVVQTRWGHLNPEDNWLTRAQVLAIDAHFKIEQSGRDYAGLMLPFNGTGGIWRSACIHDAGGWSHDTLTEDLDLSFRAQLRGWRSLFLPDVVVPGELPPQLAAYRLQQARWAKGTAQNLRRFLIPLAAAPLSPVKRLMALHHLCQYIPQLLMLILLLLTPPLILTDNVIAFAPLGIVGLIPPLMYCISQRDKRNLLAFPVLLLLGTGLIWNNSKAVISGLLDEGGEFKRTPKFAQEWQGSAYALRGNIAVGESLFTLYALWGLWLAWEHQPVLMPYLLLYAVSFGVMAVWEIVEQRRSPTIKSRPVDAVSD